jgi:hypothetical protein
MSSRDLNLLTPLRSVFVVGRSFAIWMVCACAGSNSVAVIPAAIYNQPIDGPTDGQSEPGWAAVLSEVSRAAAIPSLRSVGLPPKVREIRFSAAVSGMIWQPIPFLRLVEWPDSVAGELYLYWPRLRDSIGRAVPPAWVEQARGGCRTVSQTDKWATCRIRPRRETSWQAVADSFAALEVWALPPGNLEERRGSRRTDQEGMSAELLIGTAYRRFLYYDLENLRGKDVFRARAAAQLVASLVPS